MATIKAIEAKSVHQIQSGQVIVDLCSVVKELVENSLDADASSLEVRFKNNGLDSIEVQDNGAGISPSNYENVALKHHTSKLSNYDDLSSLQTFGFRGEALSSLCALSKFHIVTAQVGEAPKGKRLDFELSGRLKNTTVVACQKGTTACVENLFEQLPVRRKELAKNIKREYGKVIGLLHAYACICINVKFSVKNSMSKGKSVVVFATKSNATTRDNIANVYGAKTLPALVALDLDLDSQPTLTQMSRQDVHSTKIVVRGHISRPVFGEGRQTPDRQMFFVNGRPCGLPQVAKAINEVYKSFNVSQSPFIFADFQMDTNAYDVNVSPDKRTILLHNSAALIEKLKSALTDLFDRQDQTMPQSHWQTPKLPSFRQLNLERQKSVDTPDSGGSRRMSKTPDSTRLRDGSASADQSEADDEHEPHRLLHDRLRNQASIGEEITTLMKDVNEEKAQKDRERRTKNLGKALAERTKDTEVYDKHAETRDMRDSEESSVNEELEPPAQDIHVRDFNERMAEQQRMNSAEESAKKEASAANEVDQADTSQDSTVEQPNVIQNAFDRIRPPRSQAEEATITIGDKIITTVVGTQFPRRVQVERIMDSSTPKSTKPNRKVTKNEGAQHFSQGLGKFRAEGTRSEDGSVSSDTEESIQEEEEDTNDEHHETADDRHVTENLFPPPKRQKLSEDPESDGDYIDEAEKKAEEEAKVIALIRGAEESAAIPSRESLKRANKALKSGTSKDSTLKLSTELMLDLADLEEQALSLRQVATLATENEQAADATLAVRSEEERLSLTVSKDDFPNMHIIGQFNLGFILAVRPSSNSTTTGPANNKHRDTDELFIIDQHASDEKYNFERLQAETVVGNQRLVRPMILDLTAVEEEIVLENLAALEKNGFLVEMDESGLQPVGQRCKLLSLPLSKEVIFDTRDLEELIHLLAEWPDPSSVPRPTKVRKMFAMRACRSSIMIGKTLSKRQMAGVVGRMGRIDKPWNCPHGRPTMRHLCRLGIGGTGGQREGEGEGVVGLENEGKDGEEGGNGDVDVWRRFVA